MQENPKMEENVSDVAKRLKTSDPVAETLIKKRTLTTFDDLPDDCVTYIFLQLPVCDKIRMESGT